LNGTKFRIKYTRGLVGGYVIVLFII